MFQVGGQLCCSGHPPPQNADPARMKMPWDVYMYSYTQLYDWFRQGLVSTHIHTHIYIYNGFAQIGSSQNHILSFPGKLYKSIHFFGYIRFSTVPHVKTCKAKQNVLAGVLDFSAHSKNQQSLERTMERWNHFFWWGPSVPTHHTFSFLWWRRCQESGVHPSRFDSCGGEKRCIYIYIKKRKFNR